jgi:hypothetical protein
LVVKKDISKTSNISHHIFVYVIPLLVASSSFYSILLQVVTISLHLIRAPSVSGQLGGALRTTPRRTRAGARAPLPPSHFGISPHRSLLRTPAGRTRHLRRASASGTRRAAMRGPKASDTKGSGAPSSLPLPISLPRRQIPLPKPQGRLPDVYLWTELAPTQARMGGSDAGARVGAEHHAAAKSAAPAAPPSNRCSCSPGGASRGAVRGGWRGAARPAARNCLARVVRLLSRRDCDRRASAWRWACPIRKARATTGDGAPTWSIPVRRVGQARGGAPVSTDPQPVLVLVLVGVVPPRRALPLPCSGTGAPPPSSPPALCPHLDLAGEKGRAWHRCAGSLAPSARDDGLVQPSTRASLEPLGTGGSRLLIRRREPRLLASAECFL